MEKKFNFQLVDDRTGKVVSQHKTMFSATIARGKVYRIAKPHIQIVAIEDKN